MTERTCACGCGAPTTKTWAVGHHRRLREPYRVDVSTGCWVWQGHATSNGYHQIYRDGRNYMAHRWMYERFIGPIPGSLQLDHLCRNRSCVNPLHLEPVTNAENQRRGAKAKLTYEQVAEIRAAAASGRRFWGAKEFARRFGVSLTAVCDARWGRTWT